MMTSPQARRLMLAAVVMIAGGSTRLASAAGGAPAADTGYAPMAEPTSHDLQARDLFLSGRYADALAIYVRLYTETHHPTYLRNIGRCHQMMRQPGPAIDSFRSYLRDARDLSPTERVEIQGYIAEMQRLESSSPPPPSTPAGGTSLAPATSAPGDGDKPPITHRWWFWTGVGALVIAGVIAAVAATGSSDRLPCPAGAVCPP